MYVIKILIQTRSLVMKVVKYIGLVLLTQFVIGCASAPSPQLVSGNYYMTGGTDCEKFRYSEDPNITKINCYDAEGQYTGQKIAMSMPELKKYASEKLKENAIKANQYQNAVASQDTDVYRGKISSFKVSRKEN